MERCSPTAALRREQEGTTLKVPETDTPRELQFRLHVDRSHCDRAAQGLRLMARHQYRSQVQWHERSGWFGRIKPRVRKTAPAIGVLLLIAAAISLWLSRWNGPSRLAWYGLAAILFLEALAFMLLPLWADRAATAVRAWFEEIFGNWGASRMRKTWRDAPFEAVYDLRGELLAYSRVQNGQWTLRWHRQLGKFRPRGVALQVPGLIAIFAKPSAVLPAITILTTGDGAMAAAMRGLGWMIADIDPVTGEACASATADGGRSGI